MRTALVILSIVGVVGVVAAVLVVGLRDGGTDDGTDLDEPEPSDVVEPEEPSDVAEPEEPVDVVEPEEPADADQADTEDVPEDVLGEAAIDLFEASEAICADHAEAVGNSTIDPQHFAGAEVVEVRSGDPDRVVIADGTGIELVVVPARREIWGGDDPDVIMPNPYSFGCPPDLYVGTISH